MTPSALAFRLQELRLIDSGTCDRYKSLSAAKAATIAGRGEELAQRVAQANTPRPPGLLVRDAYAAYETGATTLRPYANLLGVDVDELRQALESEQGAARRLMTEYLFPDNTVLCNFAAVEPPRPAQVGARRARQVDRGRGIRGEQVGQQAARPARAGR